MEISYNFVHEEESNRVERKMTNIKYNASDKYMRLRSRFFGISSTSPCYAGSNRQLIASSL